MSISMLLNNLSRRGISEEGGISGRRKRADWAKGQPDEHTQAKKTPVCETGATAETLLLKGSYMHLVPKEPKEVNELLEAALEYASRGWAVLPLHWPISGRCSCWQKYKCDNPGKHPLIPHGKDDASTDPATIRKWWERWPEANIGISTGMQSGLLVLNINPRDGVYFDAFTEFLGFFDDNLKFPAALTGGAGLQYYFQYPEDSLEMPEQLPGFPGIYLMGAGDYVVAPPSRHASGEYYKWTLAPSAVPLVPPLPAGLMELIKPEPRLKNLEVVRDHSREQEQLEINKPGRCYES